MNVVRRGAGAAQRYLVSLYFLGVVAQFFLVGYGLFGMKAGDTIGNAHSLNAHRGFGWGLTQYACWGFQSRHCWQQAETSTGSSACFIR